jgi:exopolysaccharide biosynthesis predicted pyruvyltransferase EpsI
MIHALSERIHATLDPLVHGRSECALVDFPDHSNVGDSAIWLGQVAWLATAGIRITYRCHARAYSRQQLAASTRDGVIFIHGGGNLGDTWTRHQRFRETVIGDFPDRPIIQFPQSIHFANPANLARARAVFNVHPALTLLVRDEPSLDVARREFRATSILCPDIALLIGPLRRPQLPDTDVFWHRRTDREAVPRTASFVETGVAVGDWLDSRRPLVARIRDAVQPLVNRHPRRLRGAGRLLQATYDSQARECLGVGCRLLSRGRVVITDRLHGHILSLLLGIPHVILDNSYGKIRAFFETWTAGTLLARWADSPEAALRAARALLDAGPVNPFEVRGRRCHAVNAATAGSTQRSQE